MVSDEPNEQWLLSYNKSEEGQIIEVSRALADLGIAAQDAANALMEIGPIAAQVWMDALEDLDDPDVRWEYQKDVWRGIWKGLTGR